MYPTLIDSSAISEIPPDITFKFKKGDGGEVKANKTLLALVSKAFRNMFFAHSTMDKSATEIAMEDTTMDKSPTEIAKEDTTMDKAPTEMIMEDTTRPAFQIMIDAVYNVKPMQESLQGKTVDEIFAVLYLVNKYEIPKLSLAVKESLSSFPITEDNVLEVATDAMEYSTTFEEAAQTLLLACAKFIRPKVGDCRSFIRFVAKNGDQMATVHKLAVLLDDMPPFPKSLNWCDGCQRSSFLCLNGWDVTGKNVRVGVKVIATNPILFGAYGVGVVVRKDKRAEYDWIISWEDNKMRAHCINDGGHFLFKCD